MLVLKFYGQTISANGFPFANFVTWPLIFFLFLFAYSSSVINSCLWRESNSLSLSAMDGLSFVTARVTEDKEPFVGQVCTQ